MKTSILLLLLFIWLVPHPTFAQQRSQTAPHPTTSQQQNTAQKAALKAKLKTFKNTVKAERVNRITVILQTINTTQTSIYTKQLKTLTAILTTLEQKIAEAKSQGKDTTAATNALQNAQNTLSIAHQAVTIQEKKNYVLTISSEATAKTDIQILRNTIQTELISTQQTVQQAKQATIAAIATTKALFGITTHE